MTSLTPEELNQSRRHAARMSDKELGEMYIKGSGQWPPEAWTIIEQEVERRERVKRVDGLSRQSAGTATDRRPPEAPQKSAATAGCLGLLLGPVGLWYKRQWAAGFAWLAMTLLLGLGSGGLLAPFCWIGMAIHAFVADTKA